MNCIIIPAYQPNHDLLTLVKALSLLKHSIIIINDGSGETYIPIFEELNKIDSITILHHQVNQGKGQALKTGFQHFLDHYPSYYTSVITADADGQHSSVDIHHICEISVQQPDFLLLGCRSFENNVPWRSRLGNKLTRFLFRFFIGQKLQDTQTGLRAIPRDFLKYLVTSPLSGYDFEFEMLLTAFKQKIPCKEITIQTIYKNNNRHSHFRPLKDSIKIYSVFLKKRWLLTPAMCRDSCTASRKILDADK